MSNKNERRTDRRKSKMSICLVIGVIVLILLLFFWVDIADILGFGDGAAMIAPGV